MADRLFALVILLVSAGYTLLAFTVIKAPFQYDPLGPETWPRIIGVVAIACATFVFIRPDVARFELSLPTWARLAILVVLLLLYAELYQPAGFILATFGFASALSVMLGARILPALAFGAVLGVAGYFACTELLALNLPAGVFDAYL
jgi:putative tricarboxylic transport membrane protein